MCGWWLWLGPDAPRFGLIALAGAAMGAQSGLVRTLGAPVSTTYITGTWTGLSAGVAARLRHGGTARRTGSQALQALVVAAYLATASAAGLAYAVAGAVAAAVPLGVLVLVAVTAPLLAPDTAATDAA